ncbi:MAG TPA: response regulator transcription factor [Actinomycetota bacterium]|nr:response regulator transcription factor [Actinomycetota bacterium]
MKRILLIEDEERITSFLEKGLSANGFTSAVAATGADGLALARTGEFDLVILDLGLPDRDGFSVLGELRARDRSLPVIMLTARDAVADTVQGLESGADDYVTKPFRFEELLARIKARLRDDGRPEVTQLTVGEVTLDLRARKIVRAGSAVELSAREFALAELFFRHPGQVMTREQLLSNVWGYDYDPGSNIVDVYVGYLRKKVGGDLIRTVRGMGYRLEG